MGSRAIFYAVAALSLAAPAKAYELNTTGEGDSIHQSGEVVYFRFDAEIEKRLPGARMAVEAAADAWKGIPGVPEIRISEWPARYSDYANAVFWDDTWPSAAYELAVTNHEFKENGGQILRTVITFNGEAEFFVADKCAPGQRAFDFQSVMTHEFGHAYGMGESMHEKTDTMWPKISACDTSKRVISDDDAEGARVIYEIRDSGDTTIGDVFTNVVGCQVAEPGASKTSDAWAILFIVLAVVVGRRAVKGRWFC